MHHCFHFYVFTHCVKSHHHSHRFVNQQSYNMSDHGNGQEREREPAVHSANKWESANFGDDDQKQKFLRLMGGMKKQQTGRFVIGESTQKKVHSRTDDETKKMEETLQSQYKVGLEAKISGQNRRHVGLGFSEPQKTEEKQPKGMHTRFSDSGDESDDKQDQDKQEDAKEKRSDKTRDRERKEYREEKRRDDGARERSNDDASSSREKHRSDRHRDRDEKSDSREEDRKYDSDDKSRHTKEGRKHRQEEESEEICERKRKKHKDKKYSSDSD